jgi:dienelactone hydrolase
MNTRGVKQRRKRKTRDNAGVHGKRHGEAIMQKRRSCLIAIVALVALSLAGQAQGKVETEQVTYKEGETVLHGYLAYDDSVDSRRPGVLVVHEWWGLNEHARDKAEALAKEGYVAFAVDMYGEGKVTDHPKQAGEWAGFVRKHQDIGKARFLAAYNLLRDHKLTEDHKIAAIGYCFGGYVVLSMALEGIPLKAAVSFHGSFPSKGAEPGRIKAKILVCHGADDPLIAADDISRFQETLKQAGVDWQFVSYGGAKHSFTNPDADKRGMEALGYSPLADRRSWIAMLALFKEVFAD